MAKTKANPTDLSDLDDADLEAATAPDAPQVDAKEAEIAALKAKLAEHEADDALYADGTYIDASTLTHPHDIERFYRLGKLAPRDVKRLREKGQLPPDLFKDEGDV